MQELQIFRHPDFGEMGLIEIDGKPYFPATACAKMLGYASPRDAIKRHCKPGGVVKHDGGSIVTNQYGEQGNQVIQINYITEGNLYRLITHSRLPKAEEFERWVFDEVLPTIRRQGSYMPDITAIIRQTVAETVAEVMKQMIPVMITAIQSAQPTPQPEPEKPKQRRWKRPVSIISRLDTNLRREVESMLCDGRYTYSDVAQYLASQGVPISIASVCRYAKMLYVNYNDEEGRLEA